VPRTNSAPNSPAPTSASSIRATTAASSCPVQSRLHRTNSSRSFSTPPSASHDAHSTDRKPPSDIPEARRPAASNTPHKITAPDFQNWARNGGLYYWTRLPTQKYTPLLYMHDPGEKRSNGGPRLHAASAKAVYTTPAAFFRELPEGVPGAYRLFGIAERLSNSAVISVSEMRPFDGGPFLSVCILRVCLC